MINGKGKMFVLDTSVVLDDHRCIYCFEENHIIIPITLLEELVRFTRSNETINYNAREFTRELDFLFKEHCPGGGAVLESGGSIRIYTNSRKDEYYDQVFREDCPDHRILLVAYNLCKEYDPERIVLISNLRHVERQLPVPALRLRPCHYQHPGKLSI